MKWLVFLLPFSLLFSSDIDLYWKIEDYRGAFTFLETSKEALKERQWIQTLAKSGRAKQALLSLGNPEKLDAVLIEDLAWSFLEQKNASLRSRLQALYAAVSSQDPKAQELLLQAFDSSNQALRSMAYRLSPFYGGLRIQKKLLRALEKERSQLLRFDVIESLAMMQAPSTKEALQKTLLQSKEEKEQALIIEALCFFYEQEDLDSIKSLCASPFAAMRALASSLAKEREALKIVEPLLFDANAFVRRCTLASFLLAEEKIDEEPWQLFEDKDKLFRAYLAIYLLKNPQNSLKDVFAYFPSLEEKRLFAAAIPYCKKERREEAFSFLHDVDDLFLKANLALGLIAKGEHFEWSLDVLYQVLQHPQKNWKIEKEALFPYLFEVPVSSKESLESEFFLFSLLALKGDERLELLPFLERKDFNLEASGLFIHLKGAKFFQQLKKISEQTSDQKALQASLILALFLKDEKAQKRLKELYPFFDLEGKAQILHAFFQSRKDEESQKFLFSCLQEPYCLLRCLAAAALIQNLSH